MAKVETIRVFERVITAARVPLTRRDEMGREVRRFQGLVMLVSGTQFLAAMGLRAYDSASGQMEQQSS